MARNFNFIILNFAVQNSSAWIKILNFKTRGILGHVKFQSAKSKSGILKFQILRRARSQHGA
ncbi:hypothetical protein [uncultured Campylobacter sp.]|uniref:hypothetical protein n=1 Tax=uncultured Campylobacter sp. TaxID=218934 RepID=UPI00263236DB|nr:hypothetical protein [uncultured Campylobacter sp.]